MLLETSYVFVVAMDVDPDTEELFNEIYDTEHIPNLLKVDGVVSVSRSKKVPANLIVGGETVAVGGDEPSYIAYYELEKPDVINSEVGLTRWTKEGGAARSGHIPATGISPCTRCLAEGRWQGRAARGENEFTPGDRGQVRCDPTNPKTPY
jgi:hypothetical protein